MRLVLATSDFTIHGVPLPGFPILLEDDMQLAGKRPSCTVLTARQEIG